MGAARGLEAQRDELTNTWACRLTTEALEVPDVAGNKNPLAGEE
jgi:hypothetical protein